MSRRWTDVKAAKQARQAEPLDTQSLSSVPDTQPLVTPTDKSDDCRAEPHEIASEGWVRMLAREELEKAEPWLTGLVQRLTEAALARLAAPHPAALPDAPVRQPEAQPAASNWFRLDEMTVQRLRRLTELAGQTSPEAYLEALINRQWVASAAGKTKPTAG